MSIGITVTLPDGVLLIADGKQTQFLADGTPRTDDNNKIFKITPFIGAIVFGLVPVTDIAVPHLVATLPNSSNPDQVKAHVEQSVYAGWMNMLSRLGPGIDIYHPNMKAALIVAGLAGDTPFTTGTLFYVDREKQLAGAHVSTITTDTYGHIVLGGEEENSQSEFLRRAQSVVTRYQPAPVAVVRDEVLMGLLDAAAETIRLVEASNPNIGGIIRYVCIRKGYPYTTGSLTTDGTWMCDVP